MVLKMTGLSSRFQRNNRFWKICNGSRDISQNVSLNPWAQASRFEYHDLKNRTILFRYKGGRQYQRGPGPWLPDHETIQFFLQCVHLCFMRIRVGLMDSILKMGGWGMIWSTVYPLPLKWKSCSLGSSVISLPHLPGQFNFLFIARHPSQQGAIARGFNLMMAI